MKGPFFALAFLAWPLISTSARAGYRPGPQRRVQPSGRAHLGPSKRFQVIFVVADQGFQAFRSRLANRLGFNDTLLLPLSLHSHLFNSLFGYPSSREATRLPDLDFRLHRAFSLLYFQHDMPG
jgi:hypothetical protein